MRKLFNWILRNINELLASWLVLVFTCSTVYGLYAVWQWSLNYRLWTNEAQSSYIAACTTALIVQVTYDIINRKKYK
jgi:hypothetical protein